MKDYGMEKNQYLNDLRHSVAHLVAHAVVQLFPGTKLTIGPVTETGFFYDFLPPRNFREEDLPIIEQRMRELAAKDYKIEGGQFDKAYAREVFKDNPFKLELIDGIPGDKVGIYTQGDWSDLCRGGHLASTGELKYFKLTSISGSYWRADRNGQPLQRITGIAFASQEDMDAYLQKVEEAKLYNHRYLGKQLDLFSFHDEAPGMVFFHDKGLKIYNKLVAFSRQLQQKDYQEIKTPVMLNESLFKTSGHYDNYRENAYVTDVDDHNHWVRPMNCPCGVLVYKTKPHSYRELPLRLAEYGLCHRYELSGVLHGLFRVRTFTQDDAHIFCMPEQLNDEVKKVLDLVKAIYAPFGFTKISYKVSTRPEKSMGSDELWATATAALEQALKEQNCAYEIQEGEGAFYGPKIEIKIEDAMGREWQCGTVQIDFNMPINFELEYVKSDQSRGVPVMVHRAIYGSIERFLGILIEHYKGRFPFWLAPEQIRVVTISEKQSAYALKLRDQLREHHYYAEVDDSSDKISAKIRQAQVDQIPWMLVIGKQEEEKQTVTLRKVTGEQIADVPFDQLLEMAAAINKP